MFSENEKISLRQLKRVIVFDLFSLSALIVPRIATSASGRDGIISIILATVFAFIYAWVLMCLSKNISGNLLDFSKQSAGSIITFIIGALFVIKMFACCVFEARLFSDVINDTLLEDTDHRIIILILLLVSAYAASKGFEIRARITEVLFFIVIVPILFFLLVGFKSINYSNIMPIFTESTGNLVKGGYLVFLTFSMLELLLFTVPLIHYNKVDIEIENDKDTIAKKQPDNKEDQLNIQTNIKKCNNLFRTVSQSLLIVGIINILFFIVTVGILGVEETKKSLWSTISIIQIIKIPGGFIHRQDAIILGFWMLSIFTIISGLFYYMCLVTKQIFKVSMQNYLLIPFIIFIFGASVIPIETEKYYFYFEKYMMYIGMPQSIILPAIVVLFGKLKKHKKPKTLIKSILLLITMVSTLSLTGCSDMIEIEDRNFVQSMGIDLKDDEFTIYYELPDLKALTGQSSTDTEKLIITLKGKDFWEIEDQYLLQSNKRMDFSHLKAIILGKELAQNSIKLNEFLSYVEGKYELGRNTLIFLSQTSANDILSKNGDLNGGIGDFLDRLYRINLLKSGKKEVTVNNLIQGMNNPNLASTIPIIKANEKTVETVGLGVFANNQLIYELNEEDSNYFEIADGFGKNSTIFLMKNQEEDIKNNPEYVIKINNIIRKIDFQWNNNLPYCYIQIKGDGIIEKGVKTSGQTTMTANEELVTAIENRCNEQIKNKIVKNLDENMKGKGIDFLNLYQMTTYKNKNMWLSYKNNEQKFLKDLEYIINVEFSLK